jgi:hypothetical protein
MNKAKKTALKKHRKAKQARQNKVRESLKNKKSDTPATK